MALQDIRPDEVLISIPIEDAFSTSEVCLLNDCPLYYHPPLVSSL